MRVLFAGTPDTALPALQAFIASPAHQVVGVLTRADARRGRGRTLHPSPVAAVARAAGLDVRTPVTLRDPEVQAWVRELRADVAVVVAYGRLVPAALLDVPAHGWVNLHFSLLPAWRGAAPVQRAIIAGDAVTGASVFRLEEGLDTGPVYARITEPIRPEDTSGDLLARLADAGAPLLLDVLAGLEAGTLTPTPQDDAAATHAPVLSPADGRVDWEADATAIDRRIRGVTPAPGAYTTYAGARLRLGPVTPISEDTGLTPGALHVTKHEVRVGTGAGSVRLGRVAPAGKNWMDADAWARGARPAADTVLGRTQPQEDTTA
ncbi:MULTISPECIES: methionyl-tRNA formyltransferase [unclassified Actinomyces]|uniref:methionyl-tRNA formyltransferase n=1 Tax=unclassified Actinomyces TaxID=2609248 RepID=UPI000D598DFF|nr:MULTISPECIES: methionyl-tRNA formyltransferase [unclassified Actinomyces]RAX19958.1 methionyl-tRNA formyltransferase [Actinomyces sp. Z5]RAX20503.1 methionyl-tRNA formyltransferase [Actinomyces sp. Z3]